MMRSPASARRTNRLTLFLNSRRPARDMTVQASIGRCPTLTP
jgi:hypothetical protein